MTTQSLGAKLIPQYDNARAGQDTDSGALDSIYMRINVNPDDPYVGRLNGVYDLETAMGVLDSLVVNAGVTPEQAAAIAANTTRSRANESALATKQDTLTNGDITTDLIADDAVTEVKIANAFVDKVDGKQDTLGNGDITTALIADQAITEIKLASALLDKLNGKQDADTAFHLSDYPNLATFQSELTPITTQTNTVRYVDGFTRVSQLELTYDSTKQILQSSRLNPGGDNTGLSVSSHHELIGWGDEHTGIWIGFRFNAFGNSRPGNDKFGTIEGQQNNYRFSRLIDSAEGSTTGTAATNRSIDDIFVLDRNRRVGMREPSATTVFQPAPSDANITLLEAVEGSPGHGYNDFLIPDWRGGDIVEAQIILDPALPGTIRWRPFFYNKTPRTVTNDANETVTIQPGWHQCNDIYWSDTRIDFRALFDVNRLYPHTPAIDRLYVFEHGNSYVPHESFPPLVSGHEGEDFLGLKRVITNVQEHLKYEDSFEYGGDLDVDGLIKQGGMTLQELFRTAGALIIPEESVEVPMSATAELTANEVDKYVKLIPTASGFDFDLDRDIGSDGDIVIIENATTTSNVTVTVRAQFATSNHILDIRTLAQHEAIPMVKISGGWEPLVNILTATTGGISQAQARLLIKPFARSGSTTKIVAGDLGSDSVITAKIQNGAVTENKLASALANKINGKLDSSGFTGAAIKGKLDGLTGDDRLSLGSLKDVDNRTFTPGSNENSRGISAPHLAIDSGVTRDRNKTLYFVRSGNKQVAGFQWIESVDELQVTHGDGQAGKIISTLDYTAADIKSKIEGLAGDNRLDAEALKNLPNPEPEFDAALATTMTSSSGLNVSASWLGKRFLIKWNGTPGTSNVVDMRSSESQAVSGVEVGNIFGLINNGSENILIRCNYANGENANLWLVPGGYIDFIWLGANWVKLTEGHIHGLLNWDAQTSYRAGEMVLRAITSGSDTIIKTYRAVQNISYTQGTDNPAPELDTDDSHWKLINSLDYEDLINKPDDLTASDIASLVNVASTDAGRIDYDNLKNVPADLTATDIASLLNNASVDAGRVDYDNLKNVPADLTATDIASLVNAASTDAGRIDYDNLKNKDELRLLPVGTARTLVNGSQDVLPADQNKRVQLQVNDNINATLNMTSQASQNVAGADDHEIQYGIAIGDNASLTIQAYRLNLAGGIHSAEIVAKSGDFIHFYNINRAWIIAYYSQDKPAANQTATEIATTMNDTSNTDAEKIDYVNLKNKPTIPTLRSASQTADLLETLTGDDRLDAGAIKNLPGSSSGPVTLRTAAQTADLLETLTGDDRLDVSAIKGFVDATIDYVPQTITLSNTAGIFSYKSTGVTIGASGDGLLRVGLDIAAGDGDISIIHEEVRYADLRALPVKASAGTTARVTEGATRNGIQVFYHEHIGQVYQVWIGLSSTNEVLIAGVQTPSSGNSIDIKQRIHLDKWAVTGKVVPGSGGGGGSVTARQIADAVNAATLDTDRIDYDNLRDKPTIPTLRTASETADLLETLTGDDRLDVTAIKNLPAGILGADITEVFDGYLPNINILRTIDSGATMPTVRDTDWILFQVYWNTNYVDWAEVVPGEAWNNATVKTVNSTNLTNAILDQEITRNDGSDGGELRIFRGASNKVYFSSDQTIGVPSMRIQILSGSTITAAQIATAVNGATTDAGRIDYDNLKDKPTIPDAETANSIATKVNAATVDTDRVDYANLKNKSVYTETRLDKTPNNSDTVQFTAAELDEYHELFFVGPTGPGNNADSIPLTIPTLVLKAKSFSELRSTGSGRTSWNHTTRTLSGHGIFQDVSLIKRSVS